MTDRMENGILSCSYTFHTENSLVYIVKFLKLGSGHQVKCNQATFNSITAQNNATIPTVHILLLLKEMLIITNMFANSLVFNIFKKQS